MKDKLIQLLDCLKIFIDASMAYSQESEDQIISAMAHISETLYIKFNHIIDIEIRTHKIMLEIARIAL